MNVMIVDDTRLMRDGIATLLRAHGHTVVAQAANGRDAITQATAANPDLVLMDIRMDTNDGVEATRVIKAKHPEMKVVVLTGSDDTDDLLEAMRSGADGYLLKDLTAEELLEELDTVARNGVCMSPSMAGKLFKEVRGRSEAPRLDHINADLSAREIEVLELIGQGYSNPVIGSRLFVTENTIKYHVKRIRGKLNLENRSQLVAWAARRSRNPLAAVSA
jgi:two-component system nitrate/nitrite response regulator NarL